MYFTRNVTGLLGHTDSVLIMVLKDEANKGRRRLQWRHWRLQYGSMLMTANKKKKRLNFETGFQSSRNRAGLCSPWESTPLWWWCSPGWMATQVGSSASSRSRSPFYPRTETLPADWLPAAWPPSSSLWHRRSGSGKWLPLAPPCGTSNSQSRQRSESTLLASLIGEVNQRLSLHFHW